jgi:hypothetical protein
MFIVVFQAGGRLSELPSSIPLQSTPVANKVWLNFYVCCSFYADSFESTAISISSVRTGFVLDIVGSQGC